jgi:hypothetical protein
MTSPTKPSRRRLVQSGLAVPLVLTVRAAQGHGVAASSAMACLARDSARAAIDRPKEFVYADADDWMRTVIELRKVYRWVDGRKTPVDHHKYFLGRNNVYWRFNESHGHATATATHWNTSNCWGEATGEKRFALVYVNKLGEPIGFAFEKNGGAAVTTSCSVSATAVRRRA